MAYEHNGEDGVFTESVLAATAEPEEELEELPYEPFAEGEDPLAEEDLFADLDLGEEEPQPELPPGLVATVGMDDDLEGRIAQLEAAARELAAAEITREGRRVRR